MDEFEKTIRMTGAIQTGGEVPNQLIVRPGSDEYPEIYAHIMDIEMDVFTVTFNIDDTFKFQTHSMDYLALDRGTLDLLLDLQSEAESVWGCVQDIHAQIDAGDIVLQNGIDPLQSLYTKNDTLDVPDRLAEALSTHLHIRTRPQRG